MSDEMMNLRAPLEKSSEADFLRVMIGFAAECSMELEVGALTGAAHGKRSPREHAHPASLEPRRMAEKALAAVNAPSTISSKQSWTTAALEPLHNPGNNRRIGR
jgi:hypothetical protein